MEKQNNSSKQHDRHHSVPSLVRTPMKKKKCRNPNVQVFPKLQKTNQTVCTQATTATVIPDGVRWCFTPLDVEALATDEMLMSLFVSEDWPVVASPWLEWLVVAFVVTVFILPILVLLAVCFYRPRPRLTTDCVNIIPSHVTFSRICMHSSQSRTRHWLKMVVRIMSSMLHAQCLF